MGYVHAEILSSQTSKRPGAPCGDVISHERTTRGMTLVCCDGKGSGIKANIAATMTVSRLQELLRRGYSFREAVAGLASTLVQARETDLPYACFAAARINTDGEATVLSYEMPSPIFVSVKRFATVLPRRPLILDHAIVHETDCYVAPGEALMLMSDGITQAGLGTTMHNGWGSDGVCEYINGRLSNGLSLDQIVPAVTREAKTLSEDLGDIPQGDDCTVTVASCRNGRIVNVFTGPPASKDDDGAVITRFLQMEGQKVVCGGTTSKMVARHTRQLIDVRQDSTSMIAPPDYVLRSVDLATEGAVTLNQAFNILEEDPRKYEKATGVTKLCEMLRSADRVTFVIGRQLNAAHTDISFRQRGILPRKTIVPLLAEKLQRIGKLVTLEYV